MKLNKNQTGHHKGNSTENLLDKDVILKILDITPNQKIIDVGCGNGYMSKEFSTLVGKSGKVFAVDQSTEAIEKLKHETKENNIVPLETDITDIVPIEDKSIDLIYLSGVFHIFSKEQIGKFQQEVKRLLRPRGKLAIIEIKKENTPFGPPLNMRCSPEELKQIIKLNPISSIDLGDFFYIQLFENTNEQASN